MRGADASGRGAVTYVVETTVAKLVACPRGGLVVGVALTVVAVAVVRTCRRALAEGDAMCPAGVD